tara:strand:+ start:457 stop:1896 length:1440 start_codon:yes stop_codon:yes gene_type:complete
MSRNIKFTKATLENLKHSTKLQKWYDKTCEGLACFVQPLPSANKTYYAHWSTITQDKDGKQKRSGRYKRICRVGQKPLDEVKAEVITKLKIWKAGNITSSSVKTIGSLVEEYIKYGAGGFRVKNKSKKLRYKTVTATGYKNLLTTYILVKTKKDHLKTMLTAPYKRSDNNYYKKQLAELPLDGCTKKDIQIWHSRMEKIPAAANRALAALSVVFEWDQDRETPTHKGINPCLRVTKYEEHKDKRWIDSPAKILEIVKYCQDQQWRDPHFLTFYLLLLEYGERLSDSFGLVWKKPASVAEQLKCSGWIDWQKKEIYLRDTKNRQDASPEMTEELFTQLQKLQSLVSDENTNASFAVGSKWVFPRPTDPTQPVNNTSYRVKLKYFHYKMGLATREHIRGKGKRKVYKYTHLLTFKHLRKTYVTTYGRRMGLEAASHRMRHSSMIVTKEHYFNEDKKKLKTHKSIYDVGDNVVALKAGTNAE